MLTSFSQCSPLMTQHDLLFRAALLAGLGSRSELIPLVFEQSISNLQRTCIEAGSTLLLSVKSEQSRSLRTFQLAEASKEAGFSRWIGSHHSMYHTTHSMTETFFKNRAEAWALSSTFAQEANQVEAFQRYHAVLGIQGRLFQTTEFHDERWVSWQLDRTLSPEIHLTHYGFVSAWREVKQLLHNLFGRSFLPRSMPWSLSCNLSASEPHFKLGTTLWARLSESPSKHRQMAAIVEQLGGDDRFAEALYKLLDSARTRDSTRIGRALEIEIKRDRILSTEFFLSVPTLSTSENLV
jgi:hypothetical protein